MSGVTERKDVGKGLPGRNRFGQKLISAMGLEKSRLYIPVFAEISALSPGDVKMQNRLALAAFEGRFLSEAKDVLRGIVKDNPDNIQACNLLGALHINDDDFEAGEKVLKRVINLNPVRKADDKPPPFITHDLATTYNHCGYCLYKQGKANEAAALFDAVLGAVQEPDLAPTLSNMGRIFLDKAEHQVATRHLKKAIKLQPDFARPYCHLAQVFEKTGRLKEAGLAAQKALAKIAKQESPGLWGLKSAGQTEREATHLIAKVGARQMRERLLMADLTQG